MQNCHNKKVNIKSAQIVLQTRYREEIERVEARYAYHYKFWFISYRYCQKRQCEITYDGNKSAYEGLKIDRAYKRYGVEAQNQYEISYTHLR